MNLVELGQRRRIEGGSLGRTSREKNSEGAPVDVPVSVADLLDGLA